MSQILKSFSESSNREIIKSFTPDKVYPFFVHMCGTSHCGPNYKVTRGITSYYTIEYIISGKGYVEENGAVCYPKAGDSHIFHSGSNQLFFTNPTDPWVKIWVIFSGPCADSLFEIYDLNHTLHFPELNLRAPLEEIISICNRELPIDEMLAKCSVVVMDMIQQLYLYRLNNHQELQTLSAADQLKVIIDTMSDFNVSIDDLAKQVYCSRNHAIRLFTNKFHISPYKYISQIRLKNAKRMLKCSPLPIGDIAKSLGFCDSRYFANWFKKQTNITPKEYRVLHQN